jgi:hypothetical protein
MTILLRARCGRSNARFTRSIDFPGFPENSRMQYAHKHRNTGINEQDEVLCCMLFLFYLVETMRYCRILFYRKIGENA